MQRSRRAVQTLSRRAVALFVARAALAASALGVGTAHAAAWLPGPTLTPTALTAPRAAVGADGSAAVLSTEIGQFGSPVPAVVVRRLGPEGAQLGPLSIGRGYGIDVVALPGGGYRVAWVSPGPPSNQLNVATVDADGRVTGIRPVANLEAIDGPPVGALAAGESATVTREIVVSEPAPGPGPGGGDPGGPAPAARPAPARLRVTKAVRSEPASP